MSKLRKILLIIIFVILCSLPINAVYAAYSDDALGGQNGNSGSCKGLNWCYSDIGVRLSLYNYDGSKLVYYGSRDYETDYSTKYPRDKELHERTARVSLSAAGKVAYMYDNKVKIKWSKKYHKIDISKIAGKINLPCYYETKCDTNNLKAKIMNLFGLDSKSDINASKIVKIIKNYFGITITADDVINSYLTVEPTIYIYNKSGDSYYGTVYEILNLDIAKDGASFYGVDGVVYYDFLTVVTATNPSGIDKNNFVSDDSKALVRTLSDYSDLDNKNSALGKLASRKKNQKAALTSKGYGIGVLWIGENITSCKKECKGKTGSSLLKCAEDYCYRDPNKEGTNKNATKKEDCINKCGYKRPDEPNCPTNSDPGPTKTTCQANRTATKKTCSISGYIKKECSESTTVKYSNLLPTNLVLGNSLTYNLATNGTKTCTLTFDYTSFIYDYAIQTGPKGREKLLNKLETIKSIDKNSYKYSSKWDSKQMKVGGNTYTLKELTNKTSAVKETIKEADINLYADGKSKSVDIHKTKKFTSTNTATFELESKKGYTANATDLGSNNTKKINTSIVMKKTTSALNDTNTCYLNIGKDEKKFGCNIEVVSPKSPPPYNSDVTIKFTTSYSLKKSGETKFKTMTPPNGTLTVNGTQYTAKSKEVTIPYQSGEKVITGSVTLDGVTKTCETKITFTNKNVCKINVLDSGNELKITLSDYGKLKINGTEVGGSIVSYVVKKTNLKKGVNTFEATINGKTCSATYTYDPDTCVLTATKSGSKLIVKFENGAKGTIEDTIDSSRGCGSQITNVCEIPIETYDSLKIQGTLQNGDQCPYVYENKPKCTELYNPSKISEIKTYCKKYYKMDKAGYTSETDCVNKCSQGLVEKCNKAEWTYEQKENFCKLNYSSLGFINEQTCIDYCVNPEGTIKEFIYRPITLGGKTNGLSYSYSAFPSRSAGTNWLGHESLTVANVIKDGTNPVYVIELSKETILRIRNSNKTGSGVYVNYDDTSYKTGFYQSKFIYSNKDIFTCRNGYGSGCYR